MPCPQDVSGIAAKHDGIWDNWRISPKNKPTMDLKTITPVRVTE